MLHLYLMSFLLFSNERSIDERRHFFFIIAVAQAVHGYVKIVDIFHFAHTVI